MTHTQNDLPPLPAGTPVTFTSYGEPQSGRVIRDDGSGVVWVEVDKSGFLFRERWLHRESITVTE